MLAIPWYFTAVVHREALFGKAYFIITAISLVWGLYAGTLVDRYDRKRIFLLINLSGLAVLSFITVIGFSQGALPWYLVTLAFANTVLIYNIHFPTLYAFAQEITPKDQYRHVTSLLEIQGQLTFTIAGALAAILLKGIDHHLNFFGFEMTLPFAIRPWKIYEIFAVDGATYLIAFFIIYRIRFQPSADKKIDTSGLAERMKTGLRFLRQHPLLFHFGNASLLVFLTILIFSTYVQPVFVDSFLKQSGDVYAFGDMAFSFGALLAGFLTTKLFSEKHAVRGIIMLSVLAAATYGVMAFNKVLLIFFAANFIIGSCNAGIRIQRITYLFHHIPNHIIGRASSVFFVINVTLRLCMISAFTLPFFHFGGNIIWAVVIMAFTCLAGAVILMLNYNKLMQEPVVH
ncbi:MAG: hypothetical protein JWO06_1134 [Bacteroidota bacterium]|nr:hypothetical protein [Bacteroidota bacterium]